MELGLDRSSFLSEDSQLLFPAYFEAFDKGTKLGANIGEVTRQDLDNLDDIVENLEQFSDSLTALRARIVNRALAYHKKQLEGLTPWINQLQDKAQILENQLDAEFKEKEEQVREKLSAISDRISLAKETLKNAILLNIPHLPEVEARLNEFRAERAEIMKDLSGIVAERNMRKEQIDCLNNLQSSLVDHIQKNARKSLGESKLPSPTTNSQETQLISPTTTDYDKMIRLAASVKVSSTMGDQFQSDFVRFLENLNNLKGQELSSIKTVEKIDGAFPKIRLLITTLVSSYWKY
jgi:hypothetical protein